MLFPIALGSTLAGSAALLLFTFWLGYIGDRGAPRIPIAEMRRFVVWRMFYVNPADRRGWVPKPYGIGWTVNLRTMRNVHIFSALIVVTMGAGAVVALTAPEAAAPSRAAQP